MACFLLRKKLSSSSYSSFPFPLSLPDTMIHSILFKLDFNTRLHTWCSFRCLSSYHISGKFDLTDLTQPHTWYPNARRKKRNVFLHVGPTNSGKTYNALKRLESSSSGVYCGPLRLLAWEVAQRLNKAKVPCNLITGQEREEIDDAKHSSVTVEMADVTSEYQCAVIDEIQMVGCRTRGFSFTRALLGISSDELHLCGDPAAVPLIQRILEVTGDLIKVQYYDRLSPLIPLKYPLGSFSNIKTGDCIVTFSRHEIYKLKRWTILTTLLVDGFFASNDQMLPFRKFGYHSSACPSSGLLQLLIVWHYKVANVASYGTSTHLNHRFAQKFMGFLSTKKMLMAVKYETCPFRTHFSTMDGSILVQARDPSQVALELETALEEQRFRDAWKAYEKHINMDGFPRKSVLSKLITALAESCDRHWLDKAYTIVDLVFKEKKHELLEKEPLIYLSFILARCEMPVYASNIVRKLIQMEAFPPTAAWSAVIGHMSQTTTGAFLASELIMEIGYLFKDNRVDPRKKSNRPLLSMKPTSFVFNIALTGCLLFGTTRKAEQLLELMPRVGVKPDANLLIVMARIYEKNGHRDEIKKLKRHVDEACGLGDFEFQQFYDCLLSCHLKFGDLGSAVDMVLDMLRKAKEAKRSLDAAKLVLKAVETGKTFLPNQNSGHNKLDNMDSSCLIKACAPSYVDFSKDRNFLRLEAEATESLKLLSGKLQSQVELVMSEHGILYPTEKMYAKLVKAFLDADKINDLAAFLIKASKEDFSVSVENSTVVQVINACIALGLLDQAHDLLDEMRFSGIIVGSSVYSSLLKAYCKENRHGEIMSLFRDAQNAGIQLDSSCYEALIQSRVHHNDPREALHLFKEMKESNISRSSHCASDMLVEGSVRSGEAGLMDKLLEEIKNNQRVDYAVHDWNNVIHFFCKRKMMHDAQKALNKMRALGHTPNAQTFHSLVTAYAAIGGKYVEVTDIWGEMKVLSSSSSMKFDQELLDSLLYCFVRGGFFLRAMEVIGMMENGRMFIDKYKYRSLWLKYHRTLYKGKAPKIQTEAQLKRREAALAFKRWIGLT